MSRLVVDYYTGQMLSLAGFNVCPDASGIITRNDLQSRVEFVDNNAPSENDKNKEDRLEKAILLSDGPIVLCSELSKRKLSNQLVHFFFFLI